MSHRLEGKVAVITGAGSGIGAAMAHTFHREGASLVVADISGQEEVIAQRLGSHCVAVHADVSVAADVEAMLATAVSEFKRLDIVCNNAGIEGAIARTGDYAEEEFDRVWAVNGRGVFLGMRYALPILVAGGGGVIVNTASMAAVNAFPGLPAYCAAKGAVLQMTKTAAVEYAAQNVRVNAICPGVVGSGITAALPANAIARVERATPMGRIGAASEVANLALFLASDESSFITGVGVLIDGGYTAV